MSLTLRYHAKTSVPVEIEGVVPDRLRESHWRDRAARDLPWKPRGYRWPSCSASRGDPSDGRIDLEGDLAGRPLHRLWDEYRGNPCPRRCGTPCRRRDDRRPDRGRRQRRRLGSAARCTAALIQVAGNAGIRSVRPIRGSKKGMTDGTILIGGDVGNEAGTLDAARNAGRGGLVRGRRRVST